MKFDMIVAGVGGQGILSISYVVDNAALDDGLRLKQSEVHGMAQRGGAVVSHIRISDAELFSDIVPLGEADLVLGMEPLEVQRYLRFVRPGGAVVSSTNPFVNIPDYPEGDSVLAGIQAMEEHTLVNAAELARASGSSHAQNIVMLGAAAHLLPLKPATLEKYIAELFEAKGQKVVNANFTAFRAGASAGSFYRGLIAAGVKPTAAIAVAGRVHVGEHNDQYIKAWAGLCRLDSKGTLRSWLSARSGLLPGDVTLPARLAELDLETATAEDLETVAMEKAASTQTAPE